MSYTTEDVLTDPKSAAIAMYVHHIINGAKRYNQRTGQYMFNHLPLEIGRKVSRTSFDPFNKELSAHEIYTWIDEHLVFDGNEIIGLFHGNNLLWEK